MKKNIALFTGIVGLVVFALATPSFAADPAKERTITGEAKCGKCSLKETEKCQNVIEAEGKNGKKTKFYVVDNDVSKAFHKNVCKESKKVTATGTVKKVEGKNEFTATKIEVAN